MPDDTIDGPDDRADPACGNPARSCVDRRWMLRGGVGLAAGAALVACGADGGTSPADSGDTTPGGNGDTGGGNSNGGTDGSLAATADIPVGGGVIFGAARVVVTQPAEGEFMAFTSTCTHLGCQVTEVTGTINCPCHGSQFSIEDGSPVGGPAPAALAEMEINVEGGQITLA